MLAARMSFWRAKELVLGGGFPESLKAHDLVYSAHPLPSCCISGFLTGRGSDVLFLLQYRMHFPDKKVKNQLSPARLCFRSWLHLENSF